jgi:hypothetical protein
VVLAACRIWLWMVLWFVMVLDVCVCIILRKLVCRSASLVELDDVSLRGFRIWGHVRSPPIGGSAYVNIMSGDLCPSTTLRADVSDSSSCVTPVCDLTLPMCVVNPMLSLVCMMLSASCRRCLCGWCVKLRGSMAYLRMLWMLNALSISIDIARLSLLASSAMAITASSARLIVCLSGWDFISICVVV